MKAHRTSLAGILVLSGAWGCLSNNDALPGPSAPFSCPEVKPIPPHGHRVLSVSTGFYHACAILDDHELKCWGANESGQLGLGDARPRGGNPNEMGEDLPAVDLGTGRYAVAVSAGFSQTCALLDDGHVKCWGAPLFGTGCNDTDAPTCVGDLPDEMGDHLAPLDFGGGRKAVQIDSGGCALLADGEVRCQSDQEDLDFGTNKIATFFSDDTSVLCAIFTDGSLKCAGNNYLGQLGIGVNDPSQDFISDVGDKLPAVDLGTERHAVSVGDALYAYGNSDTGWRYVDSMCALLDDGSVKCWGDNTLGQLGRGTRGGVVGGSLTDMGDNLPIVDLGTGRRASAISVGLRHSCALLVDGSVKCWGWRPLGTQDAQNHGDQPGTMGDALPSVDLGVGRTAVAISAGGGSNTCAILDDGSLKCWGDSDDGELGQGDTLSHGYEKCTMGDALPPIEL